MDMGSDKPDPEDYPDGIDIEMTSQFNFNTQQEEIHITATCGWCNVWGDHPFRHTTKDKTAAITAWENHARIYHPARLDPDFNARTVG